MAKSKVLGPSPKAKVHSSNPSIGTKGNIAGESSTGGTQHSFLPDPNSYGGEGRAKSGSSETTDHGATMWPWMPNKAGE